MAAIAQTFLVGMGIIGLLLAIPAAIITWSQSGSLQEAAENDLFTLLSPLVCGIAILVGVQWQRVTQRNNPRRSPGRLTEDSSGGDGGGDGGAGD